MWPPGARLTNFGGKLEEVEWGDEGLGGRTWRWYGGLKDSRRKLVYDDENIGITKSPMTRRVQR